MNDNHIDIKYTEKQAAFVDKLKEYTRVCTKVSFLSKRKALLAGVSSKESLKNITDKEFLLKMENLKQLLPQVKEELKQESRKATELFAELLDFVK